MRGGAGEGEERHDADLEVNVAVKLLRITHLYEHNLNPLAPLFA